MTPEEVRRNDLLLSILPILAMWARHYDPANFDDALQDAALAVLQKLANWDPDRGRLTTFARTVARGGIIDGMRVRDWRARRPWKKRPAGVPRSSSRWLARLPDPGPGPADLVEILDRWGHLSGAERGYEDHGSEDVRSVA
jgi:DNA-directed RNA polymerase specialized sigma24 family protein